jgi:hypothetical protein
VVKIFAFIFSFYILFLSTVPCCALDNCKDETQQASNKHEHSEGCKNCSPFNQCGNCAGFVFSLNTFQINKPKQLIRQTFSNSIQSSLPLFSSSFWQPPRLG